MAGKSKQRGISFLLLVFIIAVIASVGLVGAQVFPTFLEYQACVKAITKAATEGGSVQQIRANFDRAAQIDDINAIKGKDLEVTKVGDQTLITFAYDKEIHLFWQAYLVMKYQGTSKK
jgi:hypothetical protein